MGGNTAHQDVNAFSSGVIGRRIKMPELIAAVPTIVSLLEDTAESAHKASVAITTTGRAATDYRSHRSVPNLNFAV